MINVIDQTENFGRTEKYTQVKTQDLITSLENRGYTKEHFSESKPRNPEKIGFQKHLIRFSSNDLSLKGVTDSRPEIVVINSHDGSTALKLMIGVYRFVCANGLILGDTFDSYRIRHVGDIEGKIDAALNGVTGYLPLVADKIKRFEGIQLTDMQQYELLAKASNLVLPETCISVDLNGGLISKRVEDNSKDLWTVFNKIQETILGGGLKYVSNTVVKNKYGVEYNKNTNRTLKRIGSIDRQVKINKALWDIAENYAA